MLRTPASAGRATTLRTQEGEEAESSLGVVDLRQRAARNVLQTNAVVWSDLAVGAVGVNDSNDQRSYFAGAYVQPLSLLLSLGDDPPFLAKEAILVMLRHDLPGWSV